MLRERTRNTRQLLSVVVAINGFSVR